MGNIFYLLYKPWFKMLLFLKSDVVGLLYEIFSF